MPNVLAVEDARSELDNKSLDDIERETARTWGGRAAAAYEKARKATGEQRFRWLADAENYRQECLEHAAMTEDVDFYTRVIQELRDARGELV